MHKPINGEQCLRQQSPQSSQSNRQQHQQQQRIQNEREKPPSILWWMPSTDKPLSETIADEVKNSERNFILHITPSPENFEQHFHNHQSNSNHFDYNHKKNKFIEKMSTLPRSLKEISKELHDDGNQGVKHKINYKHYTIMSVLFAILLVSMVCLLNHDSHKCTIDRNTVDTCLKQMTFFQSEIDHFPQDFKELDDFCHEKTNSVKCLRHFVEGCLEPDRLQKSYFKTFVLNYQRQLNRICLKTNERQKFLEYSECLSENYLLKNVTNCQNSFLRRLKYIAKNLQGKEKLQAACCIFSQRSNCFDRQILKSSCANEFEFRNFILDMIEGPFTGIIDSVCGPHHYTKLICEQQIDKTSYQILFEYPENSIEQIDQTETFLPDNMFSENDDSTMNETSKTIKSKTSSSNAIQLFFYENFLSYFVIFGSE